MNDIKEKLPHDTFELTAREVPSFVYELRDRYGISARAASICINALQDQFRRFGGFKEQPTEAGSVWMPYHNGSHPAYVMGVGVMLASEDGKNTETKDVVAVASAYHDWYHHFKEPEKNERQSALAMKHDLRDTSLSPIKHRAGGAILGTIVKKIGNDGIRQKAEDMPDQDARYVADADLASLVAPNAAAWALRLQIEHEVAEGSLVCTHEDIMGFYAERARERMREFLTITRDLQLKHRYLSPAGERLLQPLLAPKAAELETIMAEKHPLDYFGPKKK